MESESETSTIIDEEKLYKIEGDEDEDVVCGGDAAVYRPADYDQSGGGSTEDVPHQVSVLRIRILGNMMKRMFFESIGKINCIFSL